MEDMKFCQSCGMPLAEDSQEYGTNKDGSINTSYCIYCYKDGEFTSDCTLEEMIESCIPFTLEAHPEMSAEEVRKMTAEFLPTLERWKK